MLLDSDLAALYQVETKVLNQAVKRNLFRFPGDFMFRLTEQEAKAISTLSAKSTPPNLRSQTVTSPGGRRYLPYVFTEQGVAMLSSVLSSRRAVEVNISIMRTFVRLRRQIATQEELTRRVERLEWREEDQDGRIQVVFDTIQDLIDTPAEEPPKRRIGFPNLQDPAELHD